MEHDLSTAKVTESPPLVATIAPAAEPGAAVPAPQTPQVAKPVIQDDPKFTAFLLKDTSKVLSSFTLKPEKPGESIILRSKQTPPGTPLWTKPDENTNNCWDLFLSGKKRAGAGAPCMGVRPTGEKEYKWFRWGVERKRMLERDEIAYFLCIGFPVKLGLLSAFFGLCSDRARNDSR